MDPWTRPGVAATLWPKWDWMMEKENLFITSLAFSYPLPCEPPPRTKEHCCRSQMIPTDTWGPNSPPSPLYKHSFFAVTLWAQRLFGLTNEPLDSISIAEIDNMFFYSCWLVFLKHSCSVHSDVSLFALCMNSSSVVRLSFSSDSRDQLPPCQFKP